MLRVHRRRAPGSGPRRIGVRPIGPYRVRRCPAGAVVRARLTGSSLVQLSRTASRLIPSATVGADTSDRRAGRAGTRLADWRAVTSLGTSRALGTIMSIWAHPDDEAYLCGGPDGGGHRCRVPGRLRHRHPRRTRCHRSGPVAAGSAGRDSRDRDGRVHGGSSACPSTTGWAIPDGGVRARSIDTGAEKIAAVLRGRPARTRC